MKKTNTLFLCADEHARRGLGCYGNSFVQTPHLDKLAQRSVRFTNAYASSPLCAPTRACIATGRYTHETRYWDNGHPYDGRILGWNHHLTGSGHCVKAIGKLHYRKIGKDNGFTEEIVPMHSRYGRGDHFGLIRKNPPSYGKVPQGLAKELGPGETTLTKYDRLIGNKACYWLKNEAPNYKDKPWVLR